MAQPSPDLQRLAPEKLTVIFSRSKILLGLGIAVMLHLVLMAATSVTYVRDTWVDPEGAARRKAERLAAKEAVAKGARAAPATARATEPTPSTAAGTAPATGASAGKTPDELEMDRRKGSAVIKQITDKPKKGEIPKNPDDLGIGIDETNP